jgi:hypothetical protein
MKTVPTASQRFLATIYKIWMMRHVDVTEDIAAFLAGSGRVPSCYTFANGGLREGKT